MSESLLRLTKEARRELGEHARHLRLCGDRKLAAALDMLLVLHDKAHRPKPPESER